MSAIDRSPLLSQRNEENRGIVDNLTDQQAYMFVNFGRGRERDRDNQRSNMISIVKEIKNQECSWLFLEPVDTEQVPDYLSCIKDPIDLKTILDRLEDRENVF